MSTTSVVCQACGQGQMIHRKAYRLGGVFAFLGYILVIGALVGIGMSIVLFMGMGTISTRFSDYAEKELRERFEDLGTNQGLVEKILSENGLSEQEISALSPEQLQLFNAVDWIKEIGSFSKGAGVALLTGIAIVLIFFSVIMLLIGWLMTLKKQVLACNQCQATINI